MAMINPEENLSDPENIHRILSDPENIELILTDPENSHYLKKLFIYCSSNEKPFENSSKRRRKSSVEGSGSRDASSEEHVPATGKVNVERFPRAIFTNPCVQCNTPDSTCSHYDYEELPGIYVLKFCSICRARGKHWADECPGWEEYIRKYERTLHQ